MSYFKRIIDNAPINNIAISEQNLLIAYGNEKEAQKIIESGDLDNNETNLAQKPIEDWNQKEWERFDMDLNEALHIADTMAREKQLFKSNPNSIDPIDY